MNGPMTSTIEVHISEEAVFGTGVMSSRMGHLRNLMKTVTFPAMTSLTNPLALQMTAVLHITSMILTKSQTNSESHGISQKTNHSDTLQRTSASYGTCRLSRYHSAHPKRKNILAQSRNGRSGWLTSLMTLRSYTANYSMCAWSSQVAVPTSPAWRPCSQLATTVLMFHNQLAKEFPQT